MSCDAQNLIWLDLEMTGLDTFSDRILEIATVVTDKELRVLAEGPVIAIHQPEAELNRMDEWNRQQHGSSGLVERVRASSFDEARAEQETLSFISTFVPPECSPMCGNSICQDRRFLARCMPELEAYFHYRNLDVSTIKELVKRWAPDILTRFNKSSRHLALADIHDSIRELAFYRSYFFTV